MDIARRLDEAASRPAPVRPAFLTLVRPRSDAMPAPDELAGLMPAVAAGDRAAFAALFRYFAPRVKAYLMRAGTPAEVAEELAQEAMANVWRKAAAFDPVRAQLSTWVFAIARHLRVDHLRRHGDEAAGREAGEIDLDGFAQQDVATLDEALGGAERARGVRLALAALPPEQQLVLTLSFFEDEPHACIAERLGIPLGTVKSRIRLAVVQLRRLLAGHAP